jgi:hypothetical protein
MATKVTSILFLIILFIYSCKDKNSEEMPQTISYNTHIRPILSDKCFKCHGPDENKRISGYRLDTPEGAFALLKDQKNKYGIVKGHPETSDVYARIMSTDPDYVMPTPESNLKLTLREKELIKKWIEQGAEYQQHWAFIPLKASEVPKVKDDEWPKNPIDNFILAKMNENGLDHSEEESKELLLKRAMHDITGLPPTVQEQDAFANDKSDAAYEKAVDKALASPHYGEKMAVLWMDIARYADSHGYQDDGLRTMWPWRDWVIHAFNKNYDYKKFISWQLAGDMIPDANKESILATGFNRNHKITQEGGVIDEEYRIEYVSDRTNTFSKAMLGLTLECAKCHDHKYDPISQKDYYSTFAFFNQVNEKGLQGDIFVASLADPPFIEITKEDREGILNFISKLDTSNVRSMVMKDSLNIRQTHILNRGVYDQPRDVVQPSVPKSVLEFDTTKYERNRLGLTKWMFDEKNPLTSRVFVNLVWQEFFGRGLVRTSGDFGLQGDLPSHPELLDWLAYDFMKNGWDIKRLVKQIVTSATYRQSSNKEKSKLAIDPENIYLSSGPRIKLSSELLRDHVLSSSGIINKAIGGPSVKIYQPEGLWEASTSGRGILASYIRDKGDKLYRRGLYQFIKRTVPPPNMLIMDASNRDQCEVKRQATSTPLQSLVMLNDVVVAESSRYLAQSLLKKKMSIDDRLNYAFKSIVCRNPKSDELKKIKSFYEDTHQKMKNEKAQHIIAMGDYEKPPENLVNEVASLTQTIILLYNLEESSIR